MILTFYCVAFYATYTVFRMAKQYLHLDSLVCPLENRLGLDTNVIPHKHIFVFVDKVGFNLNQKGLLLCGSSVWCTDENLWTDSNELLPQCNLMTMWESCHFFKWILRLPDNTDDMLSSCLLLKLYLFKVFYKAVCAFLLILVRTKIDSEIFIHKVYVILRFPLINYRSTSWFAVSEDAVLCWVVVPVLCCCVAWCCPYLESDCV